MTIIGARDWAKVIYSAAISADGILAISAGSAKNLLECKLDFCAIQQIEVNRGALDVSLIVGEGVVLAQKRSRFSHLSALQKGRRRHDTPIVLFHSSPRWVGPSN
jgi:hypothetical protein